MAEEKVPDIEYYFYKDLDSAFLQVVKAVNKNQRERENIFANVMYITKQDNKKDVVVFVSKSDEDDEKGSLKYSRNASERMKQVDKEGLKKIYTLSAGNYEVEYTQIYFGDVFDGNISVEPLNTFYNGKRTLTNFDSLSSYKNCEDIECVRKKSKCDNKTYFVDNFIKFSKDEDKPHTNMFCRRYGIVEITDELNKIDNYDKFVERLENEIKTNPVIAFEVENYLRNVGSKKTKEFLAQYRLEMIRLSDEERKIADTIVQRQDDPYEMFSERIKRYIFSAEPEQRTMGNNIKIYLKYMGSDRIKDFVNRLNAELDHYYMEERERMTRISKKEPSILEMTFSVGQRISETMTEALRAGRRKFRDVKKMVEPIYKSARERGSEFVSYVRSKRQQQYTKSREKEEAKLSPRQGIEGEEPGKY
jgi:hypothetical protein